jgi:hypothetical protein
MREIIAHRPAERRGYITYDRYLPQLRILSGGQVLALRLSARASRRNFMGKIYVPKSPCLQGPLKRSNQIPSFTLPTPL